MYKWGVVALSYVILGKANMYDRPPSPSPYSDSRIDGLGGPSYEDPV